MPQIKIALIDPVGGHADNYYNYGLSIGLAKNDVQVYYFTSDKTTEIKYDGVKTIFSFSNIWLQKNKLLKTRKYFTGLFKALKFSRGNNIQILHFMVFHLDWLLFLSVMISKLRGFKVVVTLHDVTSFKGDRLPGPVERKLLRTIDQIIVHNEHCYNVLNGMYTSGHYHIIPHGNYIQFIKKVEPTNLRPTLKLLFFGQIKKVKGLDILLDALRILKTRNARVHLTIAGRVWKDNFETYQKLIDEYDIGDMVETHIKYIPNEKMWDYFNDANLIVLPYREIYQSGVLLMSMSHGRAVLTSNIPAFANVITDKKNGLTFVNDDSNSLAEKIEYISANKETLYEIEKNAYEYVKTEYDWMNSARKVKDVYAKVLQLTNKDHLEVEPI